MRKKISEKRIITPDFKYDNVLISKFINNFMVDGKKEMARKICYEALENSAKELNLDIIIFFNKVIENATQTKKITPRRFGGTTYSVPKEIKPELRPLKAIKTIIKTVRDVARQKGQKIVKVMQEILIQCFHKTGPVITKKEEMQKIIDDNAAFAHLGL